MKNIGVAHKGMVAKAVKLIAIVSMAVLVTYFVYPYTQPHDIVGVAIEKNEGSHTVYLYLLTDDPVNGVYASQLFTYTVEDDDFIWVQRGDIVVARVKGSRASIVSLRSSPVETPLSLHYEGHHSGNFGGMGSASILPIDLPQTFTVGRTWVNETWTDHAHYYGLIMHPNDKICFSFNATEPIRFKFVLSKSELPKDRFAMWSMVEHGTILVDEPSAISYHSEFVAQENGAYIFVFQIDKPNSASVTFDGKRLWS